MSDEDRRKDVNLGMFNRPGGRSLTPGDIIAAALSVVWLLICGVFFLAAQDADGSLRAGALGFAVTALALVLPVALIWVAALAVRSLAMVREETFRMQAATDQLRQGYVDMMQSKRLQITPASPRDPAPPPVPKPEPARAAPAAARQASLALEPSPSEPPLTSEELVRALHFPETAEDRAGFRALRRAFRDPRVGRLVQASQDMLTLLSQEGVYMDDLAPDRARPEIWRRFAQGERSGPITMLGGVHDRQCLERVAVRLRSDHIFRDVAHHFLRRFDHTFAALEPGLTDAEIAALSETRTFRAFMLIGRVAGTFD